MLIQWRIRELAEGGRQRGSGGLSGLLPPGTWVWGQRGCGGIPRLVSKSPPHKVKPKTVLDASRKAFNDVKCRVCPTTTFKKFAYASAEGGGAPVAQVARSAIVIQRSLSPHFYNMIRDQTTGTSIGSRIIFFSALLLRHF